MKLIGITHDEIEGWLAGFPGSLGDLGLIDTLTWAPGDDGHGVLTATWTDDNPQLRASAKRTDGNAAAEKRECLFWLDNRRRTLWGPRYIDYVVNQADAGISGAREFIYRPKQVA